MLEYIRINPEIETAIAKGKPVVALESTIISHGMPYPENVKTALECEAKVRDCG
ncbi:MAG: pseudouridine-5'-phosphate glycosidase [Candidatus Izemoplasmatales bacterium]|nr:pseudouridine-5'-phosphate glycosidase [Candidatus Izemoplasmatales bacterium]